MTTPTPAKNRKYTKQMHEEAPRYERITGKYIHEVARRPDEAAEAEMLAEAAPGNRLAPHAAAGNRITPPARRNRSLRVSPPGGRIDWR
jgi:hypothetical protein